MPKLQYFRIEFEKPEATYVPGETVTGKVSFNLSEPKNVKEIRFEARGEAKTEWSRSSDTTDSDGSTRTDTTYYGTKEHYFNAPSLLVSSNNDAGLTTLPAGHYVYPFTFQLPVKIPSSFEHTYGHVRYTVKAVLDRPWKFNQKATSLIRVVDSYDPKPKQLRIDPIRDGIVRQFKSLFCMGAGFLEIDVRSQKIQNGPIELIELIVNYERISTKVEIKRMELAVVKKLTFHDPSGSNEHDSEDLLKVFTIGPFGTKGETSMKIVLPCVVPPNLENCSIIDLYYELVLTINVTGMHKKITRQYPVKF